LVGYHRKPHLRKAEIGTDLQSLRKFVHVIGASSVNRSTVRSPLLVSSRTAMVAGQLSEWARSLFGKNGSRTETDVMHSLQQQNDAERVDVWAEKRPPGSAETSSLLLALRNIGVIRSVDAVYLPLSEAVHAQWHIGPNSEALSSVQHGGLSSLMLDETFGIAYYRAVGHGRNRGVGYTANLTCDFRAPLPAGSSPIVSTWVESIDGRKVSLRGTISTGSGERSTKYVDASCLFIVADKSN
jgi:acyl-coenzyme A thioesterase PaaI-like protein